MLSRKKKKERSSFDLVTVYPFVKQDWILIDFYFDQLVNKINRRSVENQ